MFGKNVIIIIIIIYIFFYFALSLSFILSINVTKIIPSNMIRKKYGSPRTMD